MFTYLHLHTPFLSFSPSLISLVVSVDVKHHVYLLQNKARAGCPGHSPPLTHHVSVHTMDLCRYIYIYVQVRGTYSTVQYTCQTIDNFRLIPRTISFSIHKSMTGEGGWGMGKGMGGAGGGGGGGSIHDDHYCLALGHLKR